MIIFFDTSALVKLFSRERGSEAVKQLVTKPQNEIWVLELAQIEILCAVYRKARNNEIAKEVLSEIQRAIELQFDFFTVVPMASDIIRESTRLMQEFGFEYGLRTLDALHVAGLNTVAEPEWTFISADKTQLAVAQKMGYQIIVV